MAEDEDLHRATVLHEREHEAAERNHRREHDADQRAIDLAVQGIDRRLDELNQLRKEVVLDRSQFLTVDKYDAEHSSLKAELRTKIDAVSARIESLDDSHLARIHVLEKIVDRFEGSVNTWRAIAGFLGIGGVGAVIWAILQAGKP